MLIRNTDNSYLSLDVVFSAAAPGKPLTNRSIKNVPGLKRFTMSTRRKEALIRLNWPIEKRNESQVFHFFYLQNP